MVNTMMNSQNVFTESQQQLADLNTNYNTSFRSWHETILVPNANIFRTADVYLNRRSSWFARLLEHYRVRIKQSTGHTERWVLQFTSEQFRYVKGTVWNILLWLGEILIFVPYNETFSLSYNYEAFCTLARRLILKQFNHHPLFS